MIDRRHFLAAGSAAIVGACAAPGGMGALATPDLLSDVQERAFRFFWDTTDPVTGLAPDRWPTPSFASIAAVGFALTSYGVGEKHGWITRDQNRDRTLATLEFFARAPSGPAASGTSGHKGFFYHFLDAKTGTRFGRTELSTIDTSLLLGGVLFAQSWFDRADPKESRIRALAEQLYRAVEWDWITPRGTFVSMGWHPETGFIRSDWDIYNEGMILYVLALASPTHPLPPATWAALTKRFEASWGNRWGEPHLQFAPLFGHQYSHMWVDFRGIRDSYIASKGIDYFENSRRATHAQRAYAIENPGRKTGYGADCWGLTACDGPGDFTVTIDGSPREFFSYSARGPGERDDGTIAPTAALGSIAFAPEIVEPMIAKLHARYGAGIYDHYGFRDSFNPTLTRSDRPLQHGRIVPGIGWVDGDYLGIDQGPIVLGIENRRSGMIWEVMRRNPHIRRGLERAGFTGGWLA
ncbi:Tat pathway signal protein [Sphingomonas sp. Leaf407]|uniref:glucoamylase family protein n=1 Tax=unclassified Sphingomonas TaxID=196159 RepID=UPI0007013790|nr:MULTISPECIES: glucoamylase family protein [unclassified Sphingomonas]KQN40632.1 Tat pathway signal protein [Sphingomonas sp. Leaf42]KQT29988.1 Tat pathway signal protein [Sphingomonas sp. Leaf407]